MVRIYSAALAVLLAVLALLLVAYSDSITLQDMAVFGTATLLLGLGSGALGYFVRAGWDKEQATNPYLRPNPFAPEDHPFVHSSSPEDVEWREMDVYAEQELVA